MESDEEGESREAIDAEMSKLQESLKEALNNCRSLSAPRIVERIATLTKEHSLGQDNIDQATELLANHIKDAGSYKKRMMAEKISKLDILTKSLILSKLNKVGVTSFPVEMCLMRGDLKQGETTLFKRNGFLQPLAFGSNENGRLGIGSDVKEVTKLTPVQIDGDIIRVYMGQFHTIFVMEDGSYRGCGKESNFFPDKPDSNHCFHTPVKIPIESFEMPLDIVVEDHCTKILKYTPTSTLIIGGPSQHQLENAHTKRSNWLMIDSNYETPSISKSHRIEVESYLGPNKFVIVTEEGMWRMTAKAMKILFIFDGYIIEDEKIVDHKYKITSDGAIWMHKNNRIYKGKLILAPRFPETEDGNPSEEEEKWENSDGFEDQKSTEIEETLLAVMEELVFPCDVHGFSVTEDGQSFIVFPMPEQIVKSVAFTKYTQYENPLKRINPLTNRNRNSTNDVLSILYKFDVQFGSKSNEVLGNLYLETGVPKTLSMIRALLTLKHFLYFDKNAGMTWCLAKFVKEDNEIDLEGIEKHMESAGKSASRMEIVSVKSDFSPENREQRKQEIREKSTRMIIALIREVRMLIQKLNTMPLRFRGQKVENMFISFIDHILSTNSSDSQNGVLTSATKVLSHERNKMFKVTHYTESMELRKSTNDLDMSDIDARWMPIRVEAIAFHAEPSLKWQHACSDHYVYEVITTRFHVKCIAPELLDKIEEGVLNLNNVCLSDKDSVRFRALMDSFFMIQYHTSHLTSFDRTFDIEGIAKTLPADQVYTVKSTDGVDLIAPKVLFEVYSGYDACRRRSGNGDVNKFSLDYTADAIKLGLACLIDTRVFYRAPMELKVQVVQMFDKELIQGFQNEFLKMIVLSAKEDDYEHVAPLISRFNEEIMGFIIEHRSDIIFWKTLLLPADNNNITRLHQISKALQTNSDESLPPPAESQIVSSYKDIKSRTDGIGKRCLCRILSNNLKDADIQWELMKSIDAWYGKKENRKRPAPAPVRAPSPDIIILEGPIPAQAPQVQAPAQAQPVPAPAQAQPAQAPAQAPLVPPPAQAQPAPAPAQGPPAPALAQAQAAPVPAQAAWPAMAQAQGVLYPPWPMPARMPYRPFPLAPWVPPAHRYILPEAQPRLVPVNLPPVRVPSPPAPHVPPAPPASPAPEPARAPSRVPSPARAPARGRDRGQARVRPPVRAAARGPARASARLRGQAPAPVRAPARGRARAPASNL